VRVTPALVALALSAPPASAADRAASPADATVLVRLVGSVHAEITEFGARRTLDVDRVEIGTGSGFVISPDGHVLTNDHVVSNSEITIDEGLRKVVLTLKTSRIEVCTPPDSSAARNGGPPCVEASIAATSADLDLAVLFVTGANQPYLPLGDSDVLKAGQPVQALGFPFGRTLNIGRDSLAGVVPEITTSAGTVSSLRANDTGTRRVVQIDGNVNPGNSGGPLVDREGFVVGVIQSRLKDATGIAFAIPVNQVKDFLESRGLDLLMPTRRLRLGGVHRSDAKGMAIRLPDGLADVSTSRVRFETDAAASDAAVLKVERVFSPWTPARLEQELLQADERRLARILDLGGGEKLIARFSGSRDSLAFNEGVLRESLASLEGERMIRPLDPAARVEWAPVAGEMPRLVPVPSGWLVESDGPTPCARLSMPEGAGSAVPAGDFRVAMRVAIWRAGLMPEDVSAACWPTRGSLGAPSYTSRSERLGTAYLAEGVLIRRGQRLLQYEVIAPDQQGAYARALLAQWVAKAAE
jgi:S1-C subfamily serine protease